MADERPTFTGPEQNRRVFEADIGAMRYPFDFAIDRTVIEGMMANVQTRATGAITVSGAGATVTSPPHRELFALRKREDTRLVNDYTFKMAEARRQ